MNKYILGIKTFWRTFAIIVATSTFTLGCLLALASYQYEQTLLKNVKQANYLLSKRISKEIGLFFEQTFLQLGNVAEILDFHQQPPEEISLRLNNIILRSPHISEIMYFDINGKELATSGFRKSRKSLFGSSALESIIKRKNWSSQVMFNKNSIASIKVATPVHDNKKVMGFLYATVNLKKLWWWIDDLSKISDVRLSVVETLLGQVVADQDKTHLGEEHFFWKEGKLGKHDFLSNKNILVSMETISNVPLAVITESRLVRFTDQLYDMRLTLFVITAILLSLAGLVAFLAAKQAAEPIKLISQRMIQYGSKGTGRIHETLPGDYKVIANAFNKMADDLEIHQKEIIKQEKLVTIGRLVSAVAHEVNHGLTNILSLIYRVSEADTKALNLARGEITDIKVKMNDLLEFSRSGLLNMENVDAKRVLWQAAELAKCRKTSEGSNVTVQNMEGRITLNADAPKMAIALSNLIRNSIEAGGRGTNVLLFARQENGSVEFCVADDGPGIPYEKKNEIVEPFFTTKSNGFGLGLSIVDMIARAHGGKLYITSNNGSFDKGAEFRISIPTMAASRDGEKRDE